MNKIAIPLLMVLAAGYILWHLNTTTAPIDEHVPAKAASQVRDVPKVVITPTKIKVYATKAKKRLKLPDAMQGDERIHVVESTRVQADDHPQTITTVLNTETGETETLVRREPLPWLAFKKTGEARMDYGIRRGVDRVVRLSIRQDLLQVKALYAGVNASFDSDGQYFAGVGVGYRW